MAGIIKRGKTWAAIFYLNGKKVKRSTGVKIEQHGYTKHQLKTMAQQQAERLEALAKGDAVLDKQMDALRAAAEAAGSGRRIPTVYDYITHSYRAEGGEQNVSNAKRAHKLFLTHLGSNATKRLDKITREMCQSFIDAQIQQRKAVGTVTVYRSHLAKVFNDAVREGLLTRSPWTGVKLPKNDTAHHEPFTREEVRKLLTDLPSIWQDMVKLCIYTGGQRIGDVAMLKWENINLTEGVIRFNSRKTSHRIENPLTPEHLQHLKEMKALADPGEEYVFPIMAHTYQRGRGHVSTEFTNLLKKLNLYKKAAPDSSRQRVAVLKSFHSLRAFMVSSLNNIGTPPRLVKAIVGHADNDDIEGQYYYHASLSEKGLALQLFFNWLYDDRQNQLEWQARPLYLHKKA